MTSEMWVLEAMKVLDFMSNLKKKKANSNESF